MHFKTSFAEGKLKLDPQDSHTFFDSFMSAKFIFFLLVPWNAPVNFYNEKRKKSRSEKMNLIIPGPKEVSSSSMQKM